MQACQELVDSYRNHAGQIFSIWPRDKNDPLRFFQLNFFVNDASAGEARWWEEVVVTRNKVITETDPDKLEQVWTNVVLSTGGEWQKQNLKL